MCEKNGYTLSNAAESQLKIILNYMSDNKADNFGNGRTVRNLFEKALLSQSTRILNSSTWNKNDLSRFEPEDFNYIIQEV